MMSQMSRSDPSAAIGDLFVGPLRYASTATRENLTEESDEEIAHAKGAETKSWGLWGMGGRKRQRDSARESRSKRRTAGDPPSDRPRKFRRRPSVACNPPSPRARRRGRHAPPPSARGPSSPQQRVGGASAGDRGAGCRPQRAATQACRRSCARRRRRL